MSKFKLSLGVVSLLLIGGVITQEIRPFRPYTFTSHIQAVSTVSGNLNFTLPTDGSSIVGIPGVGIMKEKAQDSQVPIASLTKMMTAYVVLQKHPLKEGENGPSLTMTANDENLYNQDVAAGDSVIKVAKGEVLTEKQMLEGLLLPSGDNMATTLANWIAGSESAFVQQMNETAKQLGMAHTHYADASGVNPQTVSTAADQFKIAEAVMKLPVFRDIVDMQQATLPVAGVQYNVNYDLGKAGIVGIKTGSTPEAGGNLAAAAYATSGDSKNLVISIVLGQQGVQPLMQALSVSEAIMNQARQDVIPVTFKKAGDTIGDLTLPWGGNVPLVINKDIPLTGFAGMDIHKKVILNPKLSGSIPANTVVGKLLLDAGDQHISVPLYTKSAVNAPGFIWKLTHLQR
ncbi:D-alanyl-D-alanine carboxypeptidase [Fodinisporobacter ferrooxydans]|uniref:D-alanyl-D-alanine carboxypeptidase n=1 Tax=Fodinisporobacter ferrooxydans TaxID=2901836 RepID=A0ABY4CDR3_9BACL|nr:D-alanyl-D-alanine carboxypeptidase [Alicyclobacillaceae bacterium MYW30-H2]